MNRNFKIMWFEDEISWFKTAERSITDVLRRFCLEPIINRKVGNNYDINELCGNAYDLILIDYRLAQGISGDTIIQKIRENQVLTDALFYSSEDRVMIKTLHEATPPIDGLYYARRDLSSFPTKVCGIIEKIIRRSEDVVNLRGFVLDDACDFEVRIKELLLVAWEKFDDTQRQDLDDVLTRVVNSSRKNHDKTVNSLAKRNPRFPAAIGHEHYLTHDDRLRILDRIITVLEENYGFCPDVMHRGFHENYVNDISCIRNALGHKKTMDGTIVVREEWVPLDSNLHKNMRSILSRYNSLIIALENFLSSMSH